MNAAADSSPEPGSLLPESRGWRWRFLVPLIILALFSGALWALQNQMRDFHWSDLGTYLKDLPFGRVLLAILATLLSYACVVGYNWVANRYAGHQAPLRKLIPNTLIINAFSLNMGAAILSSNALRFRLYSKLGFTPGELIKVVLACGLFTLLGQLALTGFFLSSSPPPLGTPLPSMPRWPETLLGNFLLLLAGGTILFLIIRLKPWKTRNWRIPVIAPRLLLGGTLLGALDWACAALVIHILLPPIPDWSAAQVFATILLAQIAVTFTGVPGGLGVLELALVSAFPETVADTEILGALLAYRLIYLLAPFGIGIGLFAWEELTAQRALFAKRAQPWAAVARKLAPNVLAIAVFVSGALLLVSGNTPGIAGRMEWLARAVPLFFIEASHFFASIAGLFLLILAWSLRRRIQVAWLATVILLGVGIVLSLLKGLDWEEALFLSLVLAALLPIRSEFNRHSALITERFSSRWWFSLLLVLAGSTWIGFLAFSHVEYTQDLWWKFTYSDHAPRFLRALAGIGIVVTALAVVQILRPSTKAGERPIQMPDETVAKIIDASPDAEACLAWLGDKRFLVNARKTAFLMYGAWGRSRIVLGDPFGPEEEWEELLWQFREECNERGMRPVIYGLSGEHAHQYVDVGLQLFKAGEEARIHLPSFSMAGGSRKELRKTISRFDDRGFSFEILPKEAFAEMAESLREVSDAWLQDKNAKEKGFSLGCFREEFLEHFPFALIRQEDKIVAFANLFASGSGKFEFSIDLMRFHPELAPNGTMQYLFTKLILWGQETGYEWFSLGIAPLSGLDSRPMAPLWHKIGATVFSHAEHFYNFKGLRAYKDKFDPKWVSAYIAVPSLLDLPPALIDTSALVSGGLVGMVKK